MSHTARKHEWNRSTEAELYRLIRSGKSKIQAAAAMGISRDAVIGKLGRLKGAAAPEPEVDWAALDELTRPCRPAGHPATWGLISSAGWPGRACQRPRLQPET